MEKELFGLRDKDGREYKVLGIVNNDRLILDYAVPVKGDNVNEPVDWDLIGKEPLPEFKVGQWAAWEEEWGNNVKHLFYITRFANNEVLGNNFDPDKEEVKCLKRDLVSVTPQEIETHLRAICDEKYIGKTTICLLDGVAHIPVSFNDYSVCGSLWYRDKNGAIVKVYGQGKFANLNFLTDYED